MQTRLIRCPICKKQVEYSNQNSFRPFCSERCRLIDLGEWASGGYSVPDTSASPLSSVDSELHSSEDEDH